MQLDVETKKCEHEGCKISASYNIDGERGKFCEIHKTDGMLNTNSVKCQFKGCKVQPTFNLKGLTAKFCVTHKTQEMIDVKSIKCIHPGCKKQPAFGNINEKVIYCKEHKAIDMINIKSKKCEHDECNTQPTFGINNATHCAVHKKDGMKNILGNICIYDGCKTYSCFNYCNEITPLYCTTHKLDNMIDIKHDKCVTPFCDIRANTKYNDYCFRCFVYTFPDAPISRNFKTKEQSVVDYIKKKFNKLSWYADKIIYDGCSKRRPDLFLDLGNQVIIVEIDEDQHKGYSCENKRLMEISQDINHRPLVFIRFNPDAYINIDNIKIKSCWKVNNLGIIILNDKIEWKTRLSKLKKEIKYWLDNETTKTIEVIELFYTS